MLAIWTAGGFGTQGLSGARAKRSFDVQVNLMGCDHVN